ncbi:FMN-binding protein [Streptomyces sp. NPDC086787]|uniref:FMN-binding protein n=1 Tax=Streptomyces sp. NPDC086787 TaxID=3365759 RepID=UPI00382DA9A8
MKRAIPVLALTVAGLIPLWRYTPSHDTVTAGPSTSNSGSSSSSSKTSSSSSKVVTGSTVTTEKGDVQVEITYEGGRISSVRMVKQPAGPTTAGAVPTLIQETLTAQSADIDSVSGATITSEGYKKSLQAAIDEAAG